LKNKKLDNKKILVTGGSGFIGSELIRFLKQYSNDIVSFDINESRFVRTIKGNICNPKDLIKAIKDFDIVFHLAAFLSVRATEQNPLKTIDINLIGTKNLLNACIESDINRIVFSSSSEIYGEPLNIPIKETELPRPKSTYGICKLASEEIIKAYNKKYGIKFNIIRFFNVYGPRQSKDFVIPKFIDHALTGKPISVYGNGSQVRSFVNVKDAVEGMLLSIKKDNEIFNIGNDKEPINIIKLGEKIFKILKKPVNIKCIDFKNSDRINEREIFNRIPDIEKARNILGYEPKINLESGIRAFI